MSLIDLSCLCIFLVCGHLSESRVVILRDYDDEPFVLHPGGRSTNDGTKHEQEAISISTRYRPKKMRSSKKAILQYGRHIYHLDNFDDLKELRSKIFESKKEGPVSYDNVDNWRAIDSVKDDDLFILPGTPLHFCNGEDCVEDRKMFRKYDDYKDWTHKKKPVKYIKRFQIVDNRHHSTKEPKLAKYDSSENNHKKKKTSKKHEKKKKKQIDSSEFAKKKKKHVDSSEFAKKEKKHVDSSESMDSEKQSSESWESVKKKKYGSEESREIIKKPRKKYDSIEDWSNSIENKPKKIKKKHKKKKYSSERKTIAVQEDYFMQGNNIFHSKGRKKKKRHDADDRRRRLEHFLPKRYHWEPDEIHELGYFWFNGPKGLYPAPKPL